LTHLASAVTADSAASSACFGWSSFMSVFALLVWYFAVLLLQLAARE
jgi:hypothetical protein